MANFIPGGREAGFEPSNLGSRVNYSSIVPTKLDRLWRHDTQHNHTQLNDIQHNDTQHKGLIVTVSISDSQRK